MLVLKALYRSLRSFAMRLLCHLFGKQMEPLADNIIIIAPHPDDETLGCGQLIVQAKQQGRAVFVIFLTDGEASHRGCCAVEPERVAQARVTIAEKINCCMATDKIYFLHHADGHISSDAHDRQLQQKVTTVIESIIKTDPSKSTMLLVPSHNEVWTDHTAAFLIGSTIAKDHQLDLYEYCVWTWYNLPYSKFHTVQWRDARYLKGACKEKRRLSETYRRELAPCGKPWIGMLPQELWKAATTKCEYYFINKRD